MGESRERRDIVSKQSPLPCLGVYALGGDFAIASIGTLRPCTEFHAFRIALRPWFMQLIKSYNGCLYHPLEF